MDGLDNAEEFKQQCLDCLNQLLEDIRGLGDGVYILNDDQLAALNVHKAEPLDIEENTIDFAPRFFTPRFTWEQTREKTISFLQDHGPPLEYPAWPKRCRRGSYPDFRGDLDDPEDFHPLCSPESDAEYRLRWFLNALGTDRFKDYIDSCNFGVWEHSVWACLNEVDLVPGCMFNLPSHWPRFTRVGSPPRLYSFHVCHAFLLATESTSGKLPHIGGTVLDGAEASEGEVLRSEVAAAIGLLKHQFRRGDFGRHHILPALVFSFQHDRRGRITQFHFDGRLLVMRQSRLLDFYSDEPTADAYHMIRWMANRPIGDTQLAAVAPGEQGPALWDNHDTNGRKPSVDVRGA